MKVVRAEFVTSAPHPAHYPPAHMPEVAFAGRSNVGKSTLINRLVNRKRLVKTSSTPGRTQLINFFAINDSVMFVDLPGYGYARVPAAVKKKWGPMVERYLRERETLQAVVLLLDVRRTPTGEDLRMHQWLAHYQIPAIHVLTKADKLSKNAAASQRRRAAQTLQLESRRMILFSAKSRLGLEEVWRAIDAQVASAIATPEEEP